MLDSTQSSTITYIGNYTDVDLSIGIEFTIEILWTSNLLSYTRLLKLYLSETYWIGSNIW